MFNAVEAKRIIKEFKSGIAPANIAKKLKVGKNRIDRVIKQSKLPYSPEIYQSGKGRLYVNTLRNVFAQNSVSGNLHVNKIIQDHNIIPNKQCYSCGIKDWLNTPIKLELDHINGDNTDNRIGNLRYLCPNCHSQTPNFRGRNLNNGRVKVSEEKIIEAIKLHPNNIRKVLLHVGLTPKGGNYDRIYKIKNKLNK